MAEGFIRQARPRQALSAPNGPQSIQKISMLAAMSICLGHPGKEASPYPAHFSVCLEFICACARRFGQHTASCHTCQAAMKNLSRFSLVAAVAAVAAAQLGILALAGVVAAPAIIPSSGLSLGSIAHITAKQAFAVACGLAAGVLVKMRAAAQAMHARFHFEDYVHAHV